MFEYEDVRRVTYGDAVFIPVCDKCGRFVKPDENVYFNGFGDVGPEPNATCSLHGRVNMIFEGFFGVED